ncbi:endo alpha-1,4 polygalactosaminidase [Nonomuraea cavernae]|uniref:endo alpha-1,4 polygalactosaminidase n=1 Tax=Nonomuraea cavernae TaxID=2045107 RepID=UPI001CD98D6A|nr:endo alpha-1,4 polygalactosaminidase [Nonomuraea cavernae]MCA2186075.1 endo alpha-1,4 polygalactosaminidase [Nonomuraea cavernae]
MRSFLHAGVAMATLASCASCATGSPAAGPRGLGEISTFTYVLEKYPKGRLDELARAPHQLAIIDLSRDGTVKGYFTREEIARLRGSGKKVLAYFEIGSIEEFRTEYRPLRDRHADLLLNVWKDWPDEHFVKYWDPRWWDQVVRPRVDQALRAGFDGVYLDTPLAYEEIDLARVPGRTRDRLARDMVDLIVRISAYAKRSRPGFAVLPQNSPELRHHPGYTRAIDGIGMEELFFKATDDPCDEEWCGENLANAMALRRQGKVVLATDYASSAANVMNACSRYRKLGIAGNVTTVALDRISPPCR